MARPTLKSSKHIREALLASEEVAGITRQVFPVLFPLSTGESRVRPPYICFRRIGLDPEPVKGHLPIDACIEQALCCSADYDQSAEMAEAVRGALDGRKLYEGGQAVGWCSLIDAEELWLESNNCFTQSLKFKIKYY